MRAYPNGIATGQSALDRRQIPLLSYIILYSYEMEIDGIGSTFKNNCKIL